MEKRDTAYYARFRIKALEDVPSKLTKGSNPAVNIFAMQEKGLDPEHIQFGAGVFKACDSTAPPSSFTSGSSYDTCLTYLMPEGTVLHKLPPENRHKIPNAIRDGHLQIVRGDRGLQGRVVLGSRDQ